MFIDYLFINWLVVLIALFIFNHPFIDVKVFMLEKELVWLTFRFLHCYFINIDLFFCLSIHILIYLLLSFLLHVSFQLFIHLHIVTFYLYFLINNLVIYLFICLSNFWCLFLVLLFQVVLCVYRLFIFTLNYFYFSKESI